MWPAKIPNMEANKRYDIYLTREVPDSRAGAGAGEEEGKIDVTFEFVQGDAAFKKSLSLNIHVDEPPQKIGEAPDGNESDEDSPWEDSDVSEAGDDEPTDTAEEVGGNIQMGKGYTGSRR